MPRLSEIARGVLADEPPIRRQGPGSPDTPIIIYVGGWHRVVCHGSYHSVEALGRKASREPCYCR